MGTATQRLQTAKKQFHNADIYRLLHFRLQTASPGRWTVPIRGLSDTTRSPPAPVYRSCPIGACPERLSEYFCLIKERSLDGDGTDNGPLRFPTQQKSALRYKGMV